MTSEGSEESSTYDTDMMVKILVGSVKMISKIVYSWSSREGFQRSSIENTKSLARSYLLMKLPHIINEKGKFRPAEVRKYLPEGRIREIESTYLTDVLNFLVRIGILQNIPEGRTPKPGRLKGPSKYPGVESYYEPTKYYYDIQNIIKNQDAMNFVNHYLSTSGMLYTYRQFIESYIIEIIRNKNFDINAAWEICKSVFQVEERKFEDFGEYYNKIRKIESKAGLQEIAKIRAKSYQNPEYLKDVFRVGGYFFKAYSVCKGF